jgi:hypothetical protein
MKPNDRQGLKAIHGLALDARQGKAMENRDGRSIFDTIKSLFGLALAGFIAAAMLGVFDTRPIHWVGMIGVLLLMAVALLGPGAFYNTAMRLGYYTVLVNLPVRGETALGWVRENFFRKYLLKLAGSSLLVAVSAQDFSFANPLQIAATFLLFFSTTTATISLLNDPWLRKTNIKLVWGGVYAVSGFLLLYYLYRNDRVFEPGGSAEWLIDLATMVTWIFPQGWVMPGRFESGGAFLAIPWCAWGLYRWISMPRDMGAEYDRPQDYATAFGGFGLDDEWDEEYGENLYELQEEDIRSDHTAKESDGAAALESLQVPGETKGGWVDDFVLRFLDSRERMIAFAMNDGRIDSTSGTNLFLKYSPIWLLMLWLFTAVVTIDHWREMGTVWLGLISIGLAVVYLVPVTNGLPMTSRWWQLGSQGVPFFALLPVTAREILKISSRITFARCLLMFPIGAVFLTLMVKILGVELSIVETVGFVCSGTLVWILSRPAFVWYRLQSMARQRSGVRLGHLFYQATELICGLFWHVGAAGCVISVFALSSWMDTGEELFETLLVLSAGALCCFLGARGTFEIFLLRLRHRKFDWLSQELNSDQ